MNQKYTVSGDTLRPYGEAAINVNCCVTGGKNLKQDEIYLMTL